MVTLPQTAMGLNGKQTRKDNHGIASNSATEEGVLNVDKP